MAQIQMPLSIWIGATRDERDSMLLSAGFDPSRPTDGTGSDGQTFRLTQVQDVAQDAFVSEDEQPGVGQAPGPGVGAMWGDGIDRRPQAGDDLRDFQVPTAIPVPIGPLTALDVGVVPVAGGISVAGRSLRLVMGGGGGRLTLAIWNSLPSLVRTALTQVGIGVGALIAFNGDIPFITLPGQGGSVPTPFVPPVDIQIGGLPSPMVGVQVVGSWNTNPKNPAEGVTFYRLSDGKLAVQNKKGRWKVWKPKRPIVLYAGGASNLKTMLKADKALTKQAKQIAGMLNRRAPRPKKTPKGPIIIESGPGNVITR